VWGPICFFRCVISVRREKCRYLYAAFRLTFVSRDSKDFARCSMFQQRRFTVVAHVSSESPYRSLGHNTLFGCMYLASENDDRKHCFDLLNARELWAFERNALISPPCNRKWAIPRSTHWRRPLQSAGRATRPWAANPRTMRRSMVMLGATSLVDHRCCFG